MENSTFVIDIDNTISITGVDDNGIGQYTQAKPIIPVIQKIQSLYNNGHKIILFTARGMRTFNNDVEKIKEFHKDNLINWLTENMVPYHELRFGKPWGPNVFYVDDRNLSINEFVEYADSEYLSLTQKNSKACKSLK